MSADTWRHWVWHLLGCGADCDQPGCTCTCHEAT